MLWQWRPYLHAGSDGIGLRDEFGDYIEDTAKIEVTALKVEDTVGYTS